MGVGFLVSLYIQNDSSTFVGLEDGKNRTVRIAQNCTSATNKSAVILYFSFVIYNVKYSI